MMTPAVRKFALAIHLTFSVGWIGAVVAYLGLGVGAAITDETSIIRAAWTSMEMIGWYVIVPLGIASLLSGVVIALGTKWGLLRYYWVLVSFMLTLIAVTVLLLHMPSVTDSAEMAQRLEGAQLKALGSDLEHPAIGLLILLVVQVLNIYKPPGLTRYGWRKQQEKQTTLASTI